MARILTHIERANRLAQIADSHGAISHNPKPPLTRPLQPPSYIGPYDERRADAILAQLKHEVEEIRGPPRGLQKIFAISSKPTPIYEELYTALLRVIQEQEFPGTLEVLLQRFKAVDGDINVAKRPSSGILSSGSQTRRGELLLTAVRTGNQSFVELLAPLADQESLDESLDFALFVRALGISTTLLQYGANLAPYQPKFCQVVESGDIDLLELLLRAPRNPTKACITSNLLPAVESNNLPVTVRLLNAGAHTNYNYAIAFKRAVERGNVGLVAAMLMAKNPPLGTIIDALIGRIHDQQGTIFNDNLEMIEALLCGEPEGYVTSHCLQKAVYTRDAAMIRLLMSHNADPHYKRGCALKYACLQNHADLIRIILEYQTIKPELASELMGHIGGEMSPADRILVVTELLKHGASGLVCNQFLFKAVATNDIELTRVLVSTKDQKGAPVCSVDLEAGRCLQESVAQNNCEMVQMLVQKGKPSVSSLLNAVAAISRGRPTLNDRLAMLNILLGAGAIGPVVDSALLEALTFRPISKELIVVLVQGGAVVTASALMTGILLGSPDIVKALLTGNVSSQNCLAAIPHAMNLRDQKRYEIMRDLLWSVNEQSEVVTQAVIDTLRFFPDDVSLLQLLCEEGKANINLLHGQAVILATDRTLEILDIVLASEGGLPTEATIECALACALDLPLNDPSRYEKVKRLLSGVKPQHALDSALIKEATYAFSLEEHSLDVLRFLLEAGADVNSENGGAMLRAVSCPPVIDILLSLGRPNWETLSSVFGQAIKLQDPMRYELCEKLLKSEAELPYTYENNFGERAFCAAVEQTYLDGIDLLLAARPSASAISSAFSEAMKLVVPKKRFAVVKKLLQAEIPIDGEVAEALRGAYKETPVDRELIKLLLTHNIASTTTK